MLMFVVIPLSFIKIQIQVRQAWQQFHRHVGIQGHEERCQIVVYLFSVVSLQKKGCRSISPSVSSNAHNEMVKNDALSSRNSTSR
jgi:hypothetical protein